MKDEKQNGPAKFILHVQSDVTITRSCDCHLDRDIGLIVIEINFHSRIGRLHGRGLVWIIELTQVVSMALMLNPGTLLRRRRKLAEPDFLLAISRDTGQFRHKGITPEGARIISICQQFWRRGNANLVYFETYLSILV